MKYRDFLAEVTLAQLRNGKDGIRLVGVVRRDEATGEVRLGLVVPDHRWKTTSDWEASYREVADKDTRSSAS